MRLKNYVHGEWVEGTGKTTALYNAVTGEQVGEASTGGVDFAGVLDYARTVGGQKLRAMTFHERARMLKALAQYLTARKEQFYEVSKATGATKTDSWIDIDGGFGTLFAYASRGRWELAMTSSTICSFNLTKRSFPTCLSRQQWLPKPRLGLQIGWAPLSERV